MRERESQQILLKDNRESEQNRYSLLTVRDAEHAMFVFSIFAVAIIFGIFSFELLIRGSGILKSLGIVLGNVSSVLSGSTLLTVFEEGVNLMFFRRAREERAKLKEEKRELEELKEEIQNLQNAPQNEAPASKSESVKADPKPREQSARPETKQPLKPVSPKSKN